MVQVTQRPNFSSKRSIPVRACTSGECVFEGNIERAELTSSDSPGSSKETVHPIDSSRSARAREMSEAPVSFVVGEPEHEPDPNRDTDPSEVQEIEDSFPSVGSDNGNLQINPVAGLVERRRRLR